MMSKIKFKIGPAARSCLKKTSPYATLLLDISCGMTEEDMSQFKLIIQADKLGNKRQICGLKHAADVLGFLDQHGYISKNCTHFLEHILQKIGRKDLGKLVDKYHEERKDNCRTGDLGTVTPQRYPRSNLEESDIVASGFNGRSNPDGASWCPDVEADDCSQHRGTCERSPSPMKVDNSQESLKSSISDEEKIEYLTGKVFGYETCDLSDIVMSSQ